MASSLVELEQGDRADQFRFTIQPEHCVGPADGVFMFGGVGMATGIGALQGVCNKPLVWATNQYLASGHPGDIMEIDVSFPRVGKNLVLASVTASIAGRETYRMSAALGHGREKVSKSWLRAPEVLRPGSFCAVSNWRGEGGLHGCFDIRPVRGRYGLDKVGNPEPEGRLTMWVRPKEGPVDKACLAILADYVPTGIGNALGLNAGGTSLDNTFRMIEARPTEWVLVDIMIEAIHLGIVHGRVVLYADDGHLMATGSQSLMLRMHDTEAAHQSTTS